MAPVAVEAGLTIVIVGKIDFYKARVMVSFDTVFKGVTKMLLDGFASLHGRQMKCR
jgi:hypothetical protein